MMTPERWQQIDKLLDEALDQDPAGREEFLARACGSDEELRQEVEKLLIARDRAGSFMETPAVPVSNPDGNAVSRQPMIGKTFGNYEILSLLGKGGMGEVYRARDSRLRRTVALKVLPTEYSTDRERVQRFRREAQTASALNHPNILTVYEIGESERKLYLATEYIDGETLGKRLANGPLKLKEALDYGIQIASALAAAHQAGVVHRDVKPENIMVRPDGLAKVLDFGLAKVTQPPLEMGEIPIVLPTQAGMLMGTSGYMSPEQVEGKKLDARSDIFSFGAVLYEMLSGRRAFQRDSTALTLAAIVKEEPKPISELIPNIPPNLDRILRRCLRKEPEHRFQHMGDVKVELEEAREESKSGALELTRAEEKGVRVKPWWVVAIIVVVLGVAGWYWFGRSHTTPEEALLMAVPLTNYPGSESFPSFSPDGSQIAFSWRGEKENNFDIYIKVIGTEPPLRLSTNAADEISPAWSPDGRWIAFLRNLSGGKYTIVLSSPIPGPERELTEVYLDPHYAKGPFLSWAPDSRWLAVAGQNKDDPNDPAALWLISLERNEKRKLTYPPAGCEDSCPAISADGHTLAFVRWPAYERSDLYLLELSRDLKPKGDPKRLPIGIARSSSPSWSGDGRFLVFSGPLRETPSLWRVAISGLSPTQQLASIGANGSYPAISGHGNRLAYVQTIHDWNIWRMENPLLKSHASPPSKLVSSTRSENLPHLSPDGKKIAFISDRSGSVEVWVCDADGANSVQLTFFGGAEITWVPEWSPDGRRLACSATPEGHDDVYVVTASGGRPQPLTSDPRGSNNPSWSRDGRWILFDVAGVAFFKVPAEGGTPMLVFSKKGWAPVESRDGRFIYYFKDEPGGVSLWKVPSAGGEEKRVLDYAADSFHVEFVDHGIYFMSPGKGSSGLSLQFLDTTSGAIRQIASFTKPIGGFSVSPDRRWIVYGQLDQSGSDLMLVENFR